MHRSSIAVIILVGLALSFAQKSLAQFPSKEELYNTPYEAERSQLQWCGNSYDHHRRGYRNEFRRYTGRCYASFDQQGKPLYRYYQYRKCRVLKRKKSIFHFSRVKCDSYYYYQQKHHPYSRRPQSQRGRRYQDY